MLEIVKLPLNTFPVILTLFSPTVCFNIFFILVGPTSTVTTLFEVSLRAPHLIWSLSMLQLIGSSMCALSLNSQSLVTTPLLVLQTSVNLMVPLNVNRNMLDRKSPVGSTWVFTSLLISQLRPVT